MAAGWFGSASLSGMDHGVEATAYLVNESRARLPELSRDPLARWWIPEQERARVQQMWEEFAATVYPHDDLVVSLRGRSILDELTGLLARHPDTVLVFCGAGFTSYPWLLPVTTAVEADLPHIVHAKQARAAALTADGVLPEREVVHLPLDLSRAADREQLVARVRELSAGRPVGYVAEGLIYYLPPADAAAVAGLGRRWQAVMSVVSYWPEAAVDNPVLAVQRKWFRQRSVPEEATHFEFSQLAALLGAEVRNFSLEEQQRRYLGEVRLPEHALVPEHLAVAVR